MKKYLMTAATALVLGGLMTSCTKDTDLSGGTARSSQDVQKTYEEAFLNTFGRPVEGLDWGFGIANSATRAFTRAKGDYDDIPLTTFAALELDFTITENFAPYIRTNGTLDLGAFSDHGYQFSHGGGDLYLSSKIGVKYDFNETISIDVSGSIGKVVNEDDSSLDIGAALAFLLNF